MAEQQHQALHPGAYISPQSFMPFPPPQPHAYMPIDYGQPVLPGQMPHQQQPPPAGPVGEETEETDSEGGGSKNPANPNYKCKPRRKATQKPVGSDQKRQAFSKRKRGIVLKAYQLYKLTDAKVFMFMVNDKGSSWAYASPSFGSSLRPEHLKHMRELADLPHTPKHVTEVMAHPKLDETDRHADNRHLYLTSVSVQDNLHLVSGSVPASLPYLPPRLPPPRTSAGASHMHDGMLPHVGHMGQQHMHHHMPHLPEQYLSHPQQHIPHAQMQPPQMHMHIHQPLVPHQLYQPPPQQQQQQPQSQPQQQQQPQPQLPSQQQQQQNQTSNPQMQIVPFGGLPVATSTINNSCQSNQKLAGEQPQQNPGACSPISPRPSNTAKDSTSKQAADPESEPQQQALGGKDGSDDAVMITASSANLGCLKQDVEPEGAQSKPASAPENAPISSPQQQQHANAKPQQPQQPHQPLPPPHQQQQPVSSLYAGRVIADPAGNLYRVVHDQLVPLLPHELEHSSLAGSSNGGGSQSPGLATLAAAAAAAVGGPPRNDGVSAQGVNGGGGVSEGMVTTQPQMHSQHPNPSGMYGGPAGFTGQPQYLVLPQHMGVGYSSLPFQAVSQPLYMDSMGGQGLGGMPFNGNYLSSQPMLSVPMSFPMGSQQAPMGVSMGGYSMISQPMSSSFSVMPQSVSQPLSSMPMGSAPLQGSVHAP